MKIKDLKKGDLFRVNGKKPVFIRGEYCRLSKKYECGRWDDISEARYFPSDKEVEIL